MYIARDRRRKIEIQYIHIQPYAQQDQVFSPFSSTQPNQSDFEQREQKLILHSRPLQYMYKRLAGSL